MGLSESKPQCSKETVIKRLVMGAILGVALVGTALGASKTHQPPTHGKYPSLIDYKTLQSPYLPFAKPKYAPNAFDPYKVQATKTPPVPLKDKRGVKR
jgi:hypothetical protein